MRLPFMFDLTRARRVAFGALTLLSPLAGASPASAQDDAPEATVNQFLASCTDDDLRGDKIGPSDYCVQMLLWEVTDPEACMDKVSYAVMAPAIVAWLRNRPDLAGMEAGDGLNAAAKALYPCP